MIFYVNAAAAREGNGSKEMPFKHINEAAKVAGPGDEVLVAPGIYREYVDPVNGGTEDARITYRSEQPLGAVLSLIHISVKRRKQLLSILSGLLKTGISRPIPFPFRSIKTFQRIRSF